MGLNPGPGVAVQRESDASVEPRVATRPGHRSPPDGHVFASAVPLRGRTLPREGLALRILRVSHSDETGNFEASGGISFLSLLQVAELQEGRSQAWYARLRHLHGQRTHVEAPDRSIFPEDLLEGEPRCWKDCGSRG